MKNLVRFAVAGALLAGFATAQAQSLPSSGSADLWLFVADTTAGTTFAEELTGQSLSSLLPTSSLAASGTVTELSTKISANFTVGPSAALTTFLAGAGSDNLEWAVDGAQYPSVTQKSKTTTAPGGIVDLSNFVETPSVDGKISGLAFGNLQTIAGGFGGDIGYLQSSGYTAGGTVYKQKLGGGTVDVWGTSTGDAGGSTDLYGQGPDQAGVALGTATSLYGITDNGGTGEVQSYVLGTNLTLSANGTLTISSSGTTTPPVPLPAAVWLFGSGLLGLIGVGRRRAAA
jgi:hypothetical protein